MLRESWPRFALLPALDMFIAEREETANRILALVLTPLITSDLITEPSLQPLWPQLPQHPGLPRPRQDAFQWWRSKEEAGPVPAPPGPGSGRDSPGQGPEEKSRDGEFGGAGR